MVLNHALNFCKNHKLIKLVKSDDLRNQIDMLNKARTDEENLVAKLEDQEKLLKDQGQTMDIKLTAALSSKVRAPKMT